MPVPTIGWKKGRIRLVDQTRLPNSFKYIYCGDLKSLWRAIKTMKVRGAPAIGIAGALGVLLTSEKSKTQDFNKFKKGNYMYSWTTFMDFLPVIEYKDNVFKLKKEQYLPGTFQLTFLYPEQDEEEDINAFFGVFMAKYKVPANENYRLLLIDGTVGGVGVKVPNLLNDSKNVEDEGDHNIKCKTQDKIEDSKEDK